MERTPMHQRDTRMLETQIVEQLRTCFDPEIPVNIYDLGLIYAITVTPAGAVHVTMTLTSPGCPAAGYPAWRGQSQGGRESWGDGCAGQCGLGPALGPQQDVLRTPGSNWACYEPRKVHLQASREAVRWRRTKM